MSEPLGFVVLARRPNPNGGYTHEILTMRDGTPMAVTTLEGAQNVLESERSRVEPGCDGKCASHECICDGSNPVEYIIGQISGVETP